MSNHGRFVWYDHWTNDLPAARDFYTRSLGWGLEPFGEGPDPYTMWMAPDGPIGGIGKVPAQPDGSPGKPIWVSFVAVDDCDGALERAQRMGGRVVTPGTDIPTVGRFGVLADPQGALIAVLQQERAGEPPAQMKPGHVGWHELHTTDQDAAWRFYSELFGWRHTSSMDMGPDGTYFMFAHPDMGKDESLGGMFESAKKYGVPAHWLYYFNVTELEPTLEKIKQNGGKVANGPMDVPGGRVAQCFDPQGAMFAVFSQH